LHHSAHCTGRIQKGSKRAIQACSTEKKGVKGGRKRERDKELYGAQIALLFLALQELLLQLAVHHQGGSI